VKEQWLSYSVALKFLVISTVKMRFLSLSYEISFWRTKASDGLLGEKTGAVEAPSVPGVKTTFSSGVSVKVVRGMKYTSDLVVVT
jgi:hypothetical protein